jgi:hypothetical protein
MIQECKIPSPQAILNGFCIVIVKILNNYELLFDTAYRGDD